MKIILFNGPPRSGKDTAGRIVLDLVGQRACLRKFAHHLKECTHRLYEEIGGTCARFHSESFETLKDQSLGMLDGKTMREFYIAVSERLFKPLFGEDYFGRALVKILRRDQARGFEVVAVTDSGFRAEAIPIIEQFGAENVTLVQLQADGTSFERDSRGYFDLFDLGVRQLVVHNPMTVEGLKGMLREALEL